MGTLEYDPFLQGVEMTAGLDRAAAERIVRATLTTLAERLGQEFVPLAARLPEKLRQTASAAGPEPDPFPAEEFVRRSAQRAGTDLDSAFLQTRAVLASLRQSLVEMEQIRER